MLITRGIQSRNVYEIKRACLKVTYTVVVVLPRERAVINRICSRDTCAGSTDSKFLPLTLVQMPGEGASVYTRDKRSFSLC